MKFKARIDLKLQKIGELSPADLRHLLIESANFIGVNICDVWVPTKVYGHHFKSVVDSQMTIEINAESQSEALNLLNCAAKELQEYLTNTGNKVFEVHNFELKPSTSA